MQIDVGKNGIIIQEGEDQLAIAGTLDKVRVGNVYSTPIADGRAYFVKSPTAKVIYSVDHQPLPAEYLDKVDAVLTFRDSPLALQAQEAGIKVYGIDPHLEHVTPELLKVVSDADLNTLHDRAHEIWSEK